MSHLVIPAVLSTFVSTTIAASYTDEEDRILDQIIPEQGNRVTTTLAEVQARPMGPVPSLCRLRMAA